MSELDKVRQRIEDKKQAEIDRKAALPKNLELVKGPILDMESELLKKVADTIAPLLQAAKSEIEDKEGFLMGDQVNFDFRYDGYSGFVHKNWKDEDGTHGETWKQLEKILIKSEPYQDASGAGYWHTYQWQEKDILPEKLIDNTLKDGNWAKTNVSLNRARFCLYNNEHKCFLYIDLAKIDSSSWEVALQGPGGIEYPTRGYKDEGVIELLAEDLVEFLDHKKYLKKTDAPNTTKVNDEAQKSIDTSVSTKVKQGTRPKEDLDALVSSAHTKDLIDQRNQDQLRQDQYRAMQEEERDRVLAQIEEMEKSDPNYQRPLWIRQEERSRRSLFDRQLNDHEKFLSDDAFNTAFQKHFPKPRENG